MGRSAATGMVTLRHTAQLTADDLATARALCDVSFDDFGDAPSRGLGAGACGGGSPCGHDQAGVARRVVEPFSPLWGRSGRSGCVSRAGRCPSAPKD